MDIRDAAPNDIETIADIYRYYVRTNICTLEESEPSMNTVRTDLGKLFDTKAAFIVATDPEAGALCGYAYSGPFNERSGYSSTCEDSIYVHKEYCRSGIGKQLLSTLLEKIVDSGKISRVIAKMSILPEQAVEELPSGRLHMSFGFRVVGRLEKVGRKFDKSIDVVILQLDLEHRLPS